MKIFNKRFLAIIILVMLISVSYTSISVSQGPISLQKNVYKNTISNVNPIEKEDKIRVEENLNSQIDEDLYTDDVPYYIPDDIKQTSTPYYTIDVQKRKTLLLEDGKVLPYAPGELIVKYHSDITIERYLSADGIIQTGIPSLDILHKKYHIKKMEPFYQGNLTFDNSFDLSTIYKLTIPEFENLQRIVIDYQKNPCVHYAEPNFILNTYEIPDDPLFDEQWALHNIGQSGGTSDADIDAPEAWDIETGDADVTIGVVDSGVDYLHPDLADNMWINSGEDINNDGVVEGENFDDTGIDGLYNWEEPGFDGWTIIDPNGDDYDPESNPNGTEGNYIYDAGEPFEDYGLDAIGPESPYYSGPDSDGSEGNGVFDAGDKDGIDNDENGYIDDIRGWDFIGPLVEFPHPDNNPFDENFFHGTHCSGIISGVTNNTAGIAGISWNGTIMPVRFLSRGGGYTEDAAKAIIYAAENTVDIISMSFGSSIYCSILYDAIEYAHAKGVVLVSAAGNDNHECPHYPSAYPHVLSVAATDHNDEKASFSNYGLSVDVAAPGVDILSTMSSDSPSRYDENSGTSMACPHVAGLAALLLSKNKNLTPDMIETILVNSVDEIESDGYIGSGRINAYKAIQMKPAIALLDTPQDWNDIKGDMKINGTVWASAFQYYVIEIGKGRNPESWIEIINASSIVNDSVLATIDTTLFNDGFYTIRLTLKCEIGGIYQDISRRVINNKQNTIFVDDDNTYGPWNGTIEYPYQYIQDGVDDAGYGDTVFVFNGLYPGEILIERSINLIGKIPDETIISDSSVGMYVAGDSINVTGFSIVNCTIGIFLYYDSTQCIISNNSILKSRSAGIYTVYSTHHTINDNEVAELCIQCGGSGICLFSSSDNSVYNNTVIGGSVGIMSYFSDANSIVSNTIMECTSFSLSIESSLYHTVCDNVVFSTGIYLWHMVLHPVTLMFWNTHTIENNTLNDEPIRYYKNSDDIIVPSDTRQVILVNCSNSLIKNLHLTDDVPNIIIAFCLNTTVIQNTISNNGENPGILTYMSSANTIDENILSQALHGIWMLNYPYDNINDSISNNTITQSIMAIHSSYYSDKVMIYDNIIEDNDMGIVMDGYAKNNHIHRNNISNSDWWMTLGIMLWYSSNNTISNNLLDNNQHGISIESYSDHNIIQKNIFINTAECAIYIEDSIDNTLYHNNFINTTWLPHVYDYANNTWYNSILKEGNYWDDYDENDTNYDGIGDTPYDIAGGENQDLYPLMSPHPLGDVNGDGVVNTEDLLLLLGAWGENPGHPADINKDGTVNVHDLLILLAHWT